MAVPFVPRGVAAGLIVAAALLRPAGTVGAGEQIGRAHV